MINWKTNLNDALYAIGHIEGEAWAASALESLSDPDAHYASFGGAIRYLTSIKHGNSLTSAGVYGSGGFNRYFLYWDGGVKFSRSHAINDRDVEMAVQRGFSIL